MVAMTEIEEFGRRIGEEFGAEKVILFGEQGSERIPVERLAQWADTIPYEIFCGISNRVERHYGD